MARVCPTRLLPLVRWPGGKTRMAKRLIAMMPPHDTYVEPFAGGASVFFAKPLVEKNVIADADEYVIKLYRDVRNGALAQCDGGIKVHRGLFTRAKKSKNACMKVALGVLSYHGDRSTYGPGKIYEGKIVLAKKLEKAECYASKLRKTTLIRGDFVKVARKHDGCNTVHFWDPPWPLAYSDKYHAHGGAKTGKSRNKSAFGKAMDPEHVAKVGSRLKGTVIVIYNWTPALAKTFRKHGFQVKRISATTQHGRGGLVTRGNMVAIKRSKCSRRRKKAA
jgi:site-specific DNA-adenine methylase